MFRRRIRTLKTFLGSEIVKHQAFVICMERASERLAHARATLTQLPLPAEILPAIDGRAMPRDAIEAVYHRCLHRPIYPFELDTGNIGCFLSHRAVWQQIVERNLDAALVLEDDAHVDQTLLRRAVEFSATHCPPDAYLQFPVRALPADSTSIIYGDGIRIVCPRVTPLRTSGQWVTRGAAEKLLAVTQFLDRPIDTTLQMRWITGVCMLAIEPSGIADRTAALGGSMIGAGKDRRLTIQKLMRQVSRARYRWKVARLSAAC
ncbi:MAG: glycosyltransferase family 25 protein, partial [Planctomycetaceae bacterium]